MKTSVAVFLKLRICVFDLVNDTLLSLLISRTDEFVMLSALSIVFL